MRRVNKIEHVLLAFAIVGAGTWCGIRPLSQLRDAARTFEIPSSSFTPRTQSAHRESFKTLYRFRVFASIGSTARIQFPPALRVRIFN